MEMNRGSNFQINLEWSSADHGPPEIRHTGAALQIVIGDKLATRVEDEWSRSVLKEVRVSAYPLGLWFASSWWRLRWEIKGNSQSLSWKMAHRISAAGHGFLWPSLGFASDGEAIEATCEASLPTSTEPIRYLADFTDSIPAARFEHAIDEFMGLLLARLEAVKLPNTDLYRIWQEVLAERLDPKTAIYRRLEAQLGFEPDEAPADVVEQLAELSAQIGEGAVGELAPACASANPRETLGKIREFARCSGVSGRLADNETLHSFSTSSEYRTAEPWRRGRLLAEQARHAWTLGDGPLPDARLAGLLDVAPKTFEGAPAGEHRAPSGLAIRANGQDRLKFLFHKRNRPGLRFEAARFIADHIAGPRTDLWLLASDTQTARQKTQRAFAAEFLCPFDALEEFLNGEYLGEKIEEAGEYFGVSELAVKSHLANHGRIPYEAVAV